MLQRYLFTYCSGLFGTGEGVHVEMRNVLMFVVVFKKSNTNISERKNVLFLGFMKTAVATLVTSISDSEA